MSTTVVCIGATLIDELYFCETTIVPQSSNPATKTTGIGGVIANIVQNLASLGVPPAFLTALGNDAEGIAVQQQLQQQGVAMPATVMAPERTGKYVSVLSPEGDLFVAVCEDNCKRFLSVAYLASQSDYLKAFEWLIIDTNLDSEVIQWLIHFAKTHQKKLIIEPVSVTKATKLASLDLDGVYMITPNEAELQAISAGTTDSIGALLARGVQNLWIRQGALGSAWYAKETNVQVGVPKITIVDSTGAGDAALAGWVFGKLNEDTPTNCIRLGHTLAMHILQQKGTVATAMNADSLYTLMKTYYND